MTDEGIEKMEGKAWFKLLRPRTGATASYYLFFYYVFTKPHCTMAKH